MTSLTFLLCLICCLLTPFAAAGLALIHQGLGRSRSAESEAKGLRKTT